MLDLKIGNKRSLSSRNGFAGSSSTAEMKRSTGSLLLWSEKHRPTSSSQLALHHSKVKAIREWILRSSASQAEHAPSSMPSNPPILILCGGAGCGKTTAVELLCKELGVHVKHWSGDSLQSNTSRSFRQSSHQLKFSEYSNYIRPFSAISQTEDSLPEDSTSSSYPSLLLQPRSRSSTVTTTRPSSQSTTSDPTKRFTFETKVRPQQNQQQQKEIILVRDFVTAGSSRSSNGGGGLSEGPEGSDFENLAQVLETLRQPLVIVLSDLAGKDDVQYHVDQLLPTNVRRRFHVETVYVPPVTALRSTKVLKTIAAAERVVASSETLEMLSELSMGDLRQAIAQLQYMSSLQGMKRLPQPNSDGKIQAFEKRSQKAMASSSNASKWECGSMEESDADCDVEWLPKSSAVGGSEDFNAMKRRSKKKNDFHNRRIVIIVESDEETEQIESLPRNTLEKKEETHDFISPNISLTSDSANITVDGSTSALHCVAKLTHATLDASGRLKFQPDRVVESCDLNVERIIDFVQWNCIASLDHSDKWKKEGPEIDSSHEESCEIAGEASFPDVMLQIANALDGFSDITLLSQRKYDASVHLDRSNNMFPAEYLVALTSRTCACARGVGFKEVLESCKSSDEKIVSTARFKKPKTDENEASRPTSAFGKSRQFLPMHRSKWNELRMTSNLIRGNLQLLRDILGTTASPLDFKEDSPESQYDADFEGSSNSSGPHGNLHDIRELAATVVPFCKIISFSQLQQRKQQQQLHPEHESNPWTNESSASVEVWPDYIHNLIWENLTLNGSRTLPPVASNSLIGVHKEKLGSKESRGSFIEDDIADFED